MSRVFVDVAAAALAGNGARVNLDPAAAPALRILAASGHEVVLVTGDGPPPESLAAVATDAVATVPDRPTDAAWYLTADVEHCRGTSARLRTVLIGPAPPFGSVHRCDGVARDLQAAAMEILAREAMPPGG